MIYYVSSGTLNPRLHPPCTKGGLLFSLTYSNFGSPTFDVGHTAAPVRLATYEVLFSFVSLTLTMFNIQTRSIPTSFYE